MLLWRTFSQKARCLSRFHSTRIDVSSEVEAALKEKRPIVALESTIITHGMPNPQNLVTAFAVEEIIREQGVVPATIAVIDGRVKVGLSREQLTKLADPLNRTVKISRRDFPFVLSHGLSGGTTVSGTVMIAKAVGINIFVTGGIGGVHKDGENTLDISADLNELGRNSIMTVCSGVKSILDIEKTLEYLETEGVCVASYGSSVNFPAFYSSYSGYEAPYHVKTPLEAAKLLQGMLDLKMTSGIIIAVPVPKEFAIDYEEMEAHIALALQKAAKEGKSGKDVTPFVLNELAKETRGKSLEANIALIKNNALLGAKVALEYSKLHPVTPKIVPDIKRANHSISSTKGEVRQQKKPT